MTYKSILVHVDSTDDMLVRAAVASELACTFDASIVGSVGGLVPPPIFGDASGVVLASLAEAEHERVVAELARASKRFRAAVASTEAAESRVAIREPTAHLLAQTCICDLIVATRPHETDVPDPVMAISLGDVIMAAGRPVLCLPPGPARRDFRNVVIAWKNAQEARRAVTDALPFLTRAEQVAVACIDETPEDALDEVVQHLARHGAAVRAIRRRSANETVVEALLDIADEVEAGLIVAGAYGHSRLREWMFGGVTRDLLRTSTLPFLVSH
jgi:nucleotide-binding universal stress UspA family protein